MSSGFNQCSFIGNLGNDPEVKYTASGTTVATISLGVSEQWKNKEGEKQERTEWVRATAFGKLGDIIGEYLKKGNLVFIQGKMRTDKYTDKDGVEKYATKIIIDEMKMLGGKRDDGDRAERQERPRQESAPRHEAPPAKSNDFADDFADDDIPF